MFRSAKGCREASSDPGRSSTAITNDVLSAGPRSARVVEMAANFVRFSFSVWMRSASTASPVAAPASTLAIAACSRSPRSAMTRAAPAVSCTGTGSMRMDDRNSSHCARACQWECAHRTCSRRARLHAEQGVVDTDERFADDVQHARVLQMVVGLVDRTGLGVLQRHDAVIGLAAGHAGEHEAHGLARHRVGVGEERAHRSLAVRARFPLVGDLHGREA